MKKIGLITFHDTTNFGSFLQTFGLYKAINDMGYTCKVLDYKCACCFRFRIRGFHAFSPDFPDRSPINRKSIMQS